MFWKAFEICHGDISQASCFDQTDNQLKLVFGRKRKMSAGSGGWKQLMQGFAQRGDGRKIGGVKFNKDVRISEIV